MWAFAVNDPSLRSTGLAIFGIFAGVTLPFASSPDPAPPRTYPAWRAVGPAFASSVGAFLLTAAAGPGWSAIRDVLGISTSAAVGLAAYLLPAALGAAVGALAGRRLPAAAALPAAVLLVPGALVTGLAAGGGSLLFGRVLTGLAAGLAWGVTAMLVAGAGPRRALAASLVAGVVALGLVAGPVVGAILREAVGWRWPFTMAVPFALVALLVTAIGEVVALVTRPRRPARP